MNEEAKALIKECVGNRKALIIKGSTAQKCPLFFRMVVNEILKESRPSARLSDAENNPVVYFDDAEKCGVFENISHAFVAPSETGVEFVVSTDRLSNIAIDEKAMINRFGGLAVFSISEREASLLDMAGNTLSNQPQRTFFYLSKTSSDKPVRLLAPFFPEIRITEVEWSIVESMKTGWKLSL